MDGFDQGMLIGIPGASPVSTDWMPVIVSAVTALGAAIGVTALLGYWIEKKQRRSAGKKPDQVPREPAAKAA